MAALWALDSLTGLFAVVAASVPFMRLPLGTARSCRRAIPIPMSIFCSACTNARCARARSAPLLHDRLIELQQRIAHGTVRGGKDYG